MNMHPQDDHDLDVLFRAQRAAAERRVPPLDRVLARRPAGARTGPRWPVMVLAAAVLLAVVGVWRLGPGPMPESPVTITVGDLRMPTDFLLEGAAWVRAGEIPRIGDVDWYPLSPAAEAPADSIARRRES